MQSNSSALQQEDPSHSGKSIGNDYNKTHSLIPEEFI
jgi:hypothetical protein